MPEIYSIKVDKSRIAFEPAAEKLPDFIFSSAFKPADGQKDLELVIRMGTPDLAHCVVFRFQDKPGGIFALHDVDGFMFAAIADSNLAYMLAKGFFGELVANARAGVDIFEDMDGSDD